MGSIPAFLLRRTCMVEPYLGAWGAYGSARPMKCTVQAKLSTSTSQAGVVRFATYTVVAQLAEQVPEGSKLTLDDGMAGYAQAVARHTGGGLPTPDHIEIAMTVALPAYGPAGAEAVTILRRTKSGQDRFHNARYTTVEVGVYGAVRILESDERDTGSRDQTTDSIEVILPPGTEVQRIDRLRIRGLMYEVDGTPEVERDAMSGASAGVRVIGRRVTG